MAKFKSKFGSKKQDWETPDELFEPLDEEFGFTLDVCATPENAKCQQFFTEEDDGLSQKWHGICWMNPPFGEQGKWVRKAYRESLNGVTVVCLLPARTNTNWWHDCCMKGEVRFIRGRPKFKGAKYGLPQPLAIVVFGPLRKRADMEEKYRMALERIADLANVTQSRGPFEQLSTPDPLVDEDGWGPIHPRLKQGLEYAAKIAQEALVEV